MVLIYINLIAPCWSWPWYAGRSWNGDDASWCDHLHSDRFSGKTDMVYLSWWYASADGYASWYAWPSSRLPSSGYAAGHALCASSRFRWPSARVCSFSIPFLSSIIDKISASSRLRNDRCPSRWRPRVSVCCCVYRTLKRPLCKKDHRSVVGAQIPVSCCQTIFNVVPSITLRSTAPCTKYINSIWCLLPHIPTFPATLCLGMRTSLHLNPR
jgi:hypothetical protein